MLFRSEEIVEELPLNQDKGTNRFDKQSYVDDYNSMEDFEADERNGYWRDEYRYDDYYDDNEKDEEEVLRDLSTGEYDLTSENKLQESKKSRIFVDKTKHVKDLKLKKNKEPQVEQQTIPKPSTKPARPMRETERPFSPKPRRTTEVQPDPKATVSEEGGVGNSVMFDGKAVEISSLQIDGVDTRDYPDFTDAYFTYGEYVDGMEMTDDELMKFQEENYDLLHDLVLAMFH